MDPKQRLPAQWPEFDLEAMLERLSSGGVDYVVIGGIAMVVHGSARLTRDLDIAFAPDPQNLRALGAVLIDVGAQLRGAEEEVPFVPDAKTLGGIELLTLETSLGWLDVHRRPAGAPPYATLRRNAERIELGEHSIFVASPADLQAMKRSAARPQDITDLEYLDAIVRLRRDRGPASRL